MFDIANIEKYRENNRLEAKAATVGLPKSLWATYSAFANTNGGIILLGVTEDAQHKLYVEGVNDAEALVINFWNIINNQGKVSINILNDKHVTIQEIDDKKVIVISVPRAQRYDKPIYLDGNMLAAYKRNGEGDYRCTKEAIQAMLRDASSKTQDMLILGNMDLEVFDKETIKRYRRRMQGIRPGHVWESLEDEDFVCLTLPVEVLIDKEVVNESGQKGISETINEPITGQKGISETINGDLYNLLLKTIMQMPYCTKNELALNLNLSVAKIKRLITELQKTGKLKRIGSNKKGQWIVVKTE